MGRMEGARIDTDEEIEGVMFVGCMPGRSGNCLNHGLRDYADYTDKDLAFAHLYRIRFDCSVLPVSVVDSVMGRRYNCSSFLEGIVVGYCHELTRTAR